MAFRNSLSNALRMVFGGVLILITVVGGIFIAWRALGQTDNLLYSLTFVLSLAVLVGLAVRYLAFLWLSYLHQSEQTVQVDTSNQVVWPPVTILVPAYNEGKVIIPAVQSLLQLDYPAYEIIVIDDGSTDDTREKVALLEGRHGDVTVRLYSKTNGGKASALNTGIALARYDFVLCIDGDSKIVPSTLRVVMPHFANPAVAAVAGNVKVVNRNNLLTRFQALEYVQGLNLARRAQGFVHAVNIIPGPLGCFRRQVLLELGGYDSDTFAEDADLTLKILQQGYHIVYEDKAVALTEAPENRHALTKQRYRWARGLLQAARKRKAMLVNPLNFWVWSSLVTLLLEGIVLPVANIVLNGMFALTSIASGEFGTFVVLWYLMFIFLDLVATAYCVSAEQEELGLIPLALLMRYAYTPFVDVTKMMACVDELRSVEMTWGKLQREGRL